MGFPFTVEFTVGNSTLMPPPEKITGNTLWVSPPRSPSTVNWRPIVPVVDRGWPDHFRRSVWYVRSETSPPFVDRQNTFSTVFSPDANHGVRFSPPLETGFAGTKFTHVRSALKTREIFPKRERGGFYPPRTISTGTGVGRERRPYEACCSICWFLHVLR